MILIIKINCNYHIRSHKNENDLKKTFQVVDFY